MTAELELRSDERAVLEAACHQLDELAVLEAALADAEPVVVGSVGQPKVNPLFAEARGHRAELRRLLGALEVEAAADDVVVSPGVSNVSASARRRWANDRRDRQERKAEGHGA